MKAVLWTLHLLTMSAAVLACSEPLRPLQSWRGGPTLDTNETVHTDATVMFVPIEGGCWALRTPRGDYEPAGLPQKYRVNGLRVRVVIRGGKAGSFCMIAPVVAVDSISMR